MRAVRWVLGGVVTAVIGLVVATAFTEFDVKDWLFPPDPVACPSTSTSLQTGDPVPTADAVVVHEGTADGSNGNVVGFKICRDQSPQAMSEFWYFGMSPGPSTNLAPATLVRPDPARYETAVSDSTFYFVDCATNTFGYTTDGVEKPYVFDPSEC